jgi:ABC-type multidrug transport system fused ATPase/permease subunit
MDIAYILSVLINFLGAFLLILTYTYIDKLEKIGCACSQHKYRPFIKGYSVFAIFFVLFTMFFPPHIAAKTFGGIIGLIYFLIIVLFCVATIVFFVYTIIYVRYLMREKCKCSEDIRREIIFAWSIVEISCLTALIVLPLMMGVIGGTYFVTVTTIKDIGRGEQNVMETLMNPVKAVTKFPSSVKNLPKNMKKSFKKYKK